MCNQVSTHGCQEACSRPGIAAVTADLRSNSSGNQENRIKISFIFILTSPKIKQGQLCLARGHAQNAQFAEESIRGLTRNDKANHLLTCSDLIRDCPAQQKDKVGSIAILIYGYL